jgi:hypothetical protein
MSMLLDYVIVQTVIRLTRDPPGARLVATRTRPEVGRGRTSSLRTGRRHAL